MVAVQRLSLADFRSWESVEVEFGPGVNALVGPNGQGKTNIVEAIGYLATLGSHRVATDAPLIRRGAEQARILADIDSGGRAVSIEVEINPGRANRGRVNRGSLGRARDVLGIVSAVIFAPEDLVLVKGDPSDRRRFLDDLLVQRYPRMSGVRSDYDRVLRQRNALLKSSGAARRGNEEQVLRTLEAWDGQVISLGAEIMRERRMLVEALSPCAAEAYADLAPGAEALGLAYVTSIGPAEGIPWDDEGLPAALRSAIEERRREEFDRGITLVGPHRDELTLTLGPAPVRGYASHGESWSAALALRLASYDLLAAEGDRPVLILDDVFAELDTRRRERLAARMGAEAQVIVTAAVPEDVPGGPEAIDGQWIDVGEGRVSSRGR